MQCVLQSSQTLETLRSEAVAHVVRTQFVENTGNSGGICKQAGSLTKTAFVVDGVELARVQHGIPVGQVDLGLIKLRARVFELGEEASGHKVMIVLVDLAKGITDCQVSFVVVDQMFFAAGHGNTTVRAFVTDMCGRHSTCLSDLNIIRTGGLAGGRVVGVRAVSILFDECGALANFGRGRVAEGMEQISR